MNALVLFDIDGTLVDVRGAGRRAFARALAETWGVVDDLAHVSFAGGTDLGVLAELRALHALDEALHDAFFRAMERTLADELERNAPRALPGAAALVDALAPRATLGLLTGNAKACARVKIERAGIAWRFAVGAYGDEHADRNELARRLVVSRERHERVVVIGDTPNDIAAARAIDAHAIAVTTGRYGAAELAHADEVVDSLERLDVDALAGAR